MPKPSSVVPKQYGGEENQRETQLKVSVHGQIGARGHWEANVSSGTTSLLLVECCLALGEDTSRSNCTMNSSKCLRAHFAHSRDKGPLYTRLSLRIIAHDLNAMILNQFSSGNPSKQRASKVTGNINRALSLIDN